VPAVELPIARMVWDNDQFRLAQSEGVHHRDGKRTRSGCPDVRRLADAARMCVGHEPDDPIVADRFNALAVTASDRTRASIRD
jgi:hypothetical protein